jgi:hypothetical protein
MVIFGGYFCDGGSYPIVNNMVAMMALLILLRIPYEEMKVMKR